MNISNPPRDETSSVETPLADALSFIETQFPVAKISMESYKERTAKQSQTLTGLGKWWGRKPLVLVRAALLGLLMPASDDPIKDREIFLRLMTMDHEGLLRRKSKSIPGRRLVEELQSMPPGVKKRFLDKDGVNLKRGLSKDDRADLQSLVFNRLSYVDKLSFCDRPEQTDGPSAEAWSEINAYLSTNAGHLETFVEELGRRRFGHRPRVGDAFCGGGSIPFEAARLGCDVYGSDLNPVAALLTWAALNVLGGGPELIADVEQAQKEVYNAVQQKVDEWGIEQNSAGWQADAYLYCMEAIDPESGWKVPLSPSWVIGKKPNTIAKLVPDAPNKRFDIEVNEYASDADMEKADRGTVQNSRLVPPHGVGDQTPIEVLRTSMRQWNKVDTTPQPDDVFQERLYCVRWAHIYQDENDREQVERYYRSSNQADMQREENVREILSEVKETWQENGLIPTLAVEPGDETTRLQRERGWTYWHHLFHPRQLLILGSLHAEARRYKQDLPVYVSMLLGLSRCADYNSKLSRWHPRSIGDKSEQTFSNQALNTLYNYACRPVRALESSWMLNLTPTKISTDSKVETADARTINYKADIWITDPPYADAVNYHELSEFFLAWHGYSLKEIFPSWHVDSRRALAVKGNDESFSRSMVECYKRLAECMPDNGLQIVMFTHQDASVWADLTMILWAAGLRVTAAWTIATETDSALKQGNYVQGTVLLVLRKRTETEPVFLDEITHEIEAEVRRQLDSMTALEDDSDPNFGDADYQLAAYAAALRVLTARPIYEIDPAKEILRERPRGEVGIVEQLIRDAVKIACDHLVPRDFDADLWKTLSPAERFYCKGVEVESHGEHRSGVYQELARGFGAADYTDLMGNTRANETRLKTPTEFGRRMLSGDGFGGTLLRQVLFAVQLSAKSEETRDGLNYLKTERPDYWNERAKIVQLLGYLARLRDVAGMDHWRKDAAAADLLAGAVRNDHV